MKSSIGKKMLVMIFVPFFVIFLILAVFISNMVFQYTTNWTELEIKGISSINAADLEGKMDSVRISVLSTAEILTKINLKSDDAREQAEEAIKSMFMNESVYNAWLAYEPQAFDGRDEDFTEDYPGAPSGRFIRSYVIEEGEILVAPDMDEDTIDDTEESPWYAIPRDTGKLYIDVDNSNANLYDYGVGQAPAYTLSIVAPIILDGQVVGCVGADVLFDSMIFGIDSERQAVVAVFYPNGRVFYSPSIDYAEESIETLQFKNVDAIRNALESGETLFLPNEHCIFNGQDSFTYFHPIYTKHESAGSLFLYVAAPRSLAYDSLWPVVGMIAVIALTVFAVLFILFFYITKIISEPIKELTFAAGAISQGNIETEIRYFSKSKNEVGLLSQSLFRMVEQFRVYIAKLEQNQEEMLMRSRIDDLTNSAGSTKEVFDGLADMLCDHFHINRAVIVYAGVGNAVVLACRETGGPPCSKACGNGTASVFTCHTQTEAMLKDKKLIFLNKHAIEAHKVVYAGPKAASVCIVPLRNGKLLGYIILVNNVAKKTLSAGNEAALLYTAKVLGGWLAQKESQVRLDMGLADNRRESFLNTNVKPTKKTSSFIMDDKSSGKSASDNKLLDQNPKVENDESEFIKALKKIGWLDVDAALKSMGGLSDVYEQSVKLTARLIPEAAERMDKHLAAKDAKGFTIEVHGAKGSLNNIGAFELGKTAARLEKAALAGDLEFCRENYPKFRDSIMDFSKSLEPLAGDTGSDTKEKEKGDAEKLKTALEKAKTAAAGFDSVEAFETISPIAGFSYGEEQDGLIKEIILALEVFDCDKALKNMAELEGKLN